MTDKINEFKKAFDERTKNGLKEGDQPGFALRCMIDRVECIFETIGELTEYKSFTSTETEKDLMIELYLGGTSLLSYFKYFDEDYTEYVEMITKTNKEVMNNDRN